MREYLTGHLGDFTVATAVSIALQVLLALRFALRYAMAQGRFLFPLLVPIALLIAIGIELLGARKVSEAPHVHAVGFLTTYVLAFTGFSVGWFHGLDGW